MDHQWGPFFVSPVSIGKMFESYEWFSIQLNNGYEIMVSNIYNRANELPEDPSYGDVQLFDPEGNSSIASNSTFLRTKYWQDTSSGKYLSMEWTLFVPEWGLNLELKPEFENQMVRFPLNGDFWEGSIKVRGTLENEQVTGLAYGELVHDFKIPKVRLENLMKKYQEDAEVNFNWTIINPDAGNPLKFQLFLVLDDQESIKIASEISENHYQLNLSQLSGIKTFKIKVKACSIDQLICGEKISHNIKVGMAHEN